MSTFLKDLMEFPFLQHAVLAGILCSIGSGVVGTYVVFRRITYIAAAILQLMLVASVHQILQQTVAFPLKFMLQIQTGILLNLVTIL